MQKEKVRLIKLMVPARKATPMPPTGTTLGQHGINISDFCKKFNDRSQFYEEGLLLPVHLILYKDKSFEFVIKLPFCTTLLKSLLTEGDSKIVSISDLYKISVIKSLDSSLPMYALFKQILGTARSMKLDIQI